MNSSLKLIIAIIFASNLVLADDRETDPIESRQASMKEMGKAMKVLGPIFQNKVEYDANAVMDAAQSLANAAIAEDMENLFPEGSLNEDSKAKAEIWENWNEFSQYLNDLEIAANELSLYGGSGLNEGAIYFNSVADACSSCHKKYRVKKK